MTFGSFLQKFVCGIIGGVGFVLLGGAYFLFNFTSYFPKKFKCVGTVSEVWCYPVTGCQGLSSETGQCMTSGLAIMGVRDRSFFIGVNKGMNEAVLYVSPNLKQIQALTDGRNLTLSFPEKPEIKYTLRRPSLAPALVQYTMSYMGASIAVDACTGEINKWLDDCLEEEGLTFFTTSQRHTQTNKNFRHSVYVFATESSVESLNDNFKFTTPVSMEFFRPNIVIANSEPLDEGQWENIRIGDAVFSVLSSDARFIQQNFDVVNQDWRYQVEYFKPLGQLITLPASCYNASYGVLAKVIQEGDINVGDPVYVTYRL